MNKSRLSRIRKLWKSPKPLNKEGDRPEYISAKQLASVIGKILFMALAIGPARLITRNLYTLFKARTERYCTLENTPGARK